MVAYRYYKNNLFQKRSNQNVEFSIIQKYFRTFNAYLSPKTCFFYRNLSLEMHNFNIVINKLYLKIDCNVWFGFFWPLRTKVFFGPCSL